MKKKVAIIQSNYVPWKGYFDIINRVDEFIFLDDVQYTRRDWRNRNLIKTSTGLQWLTIPVQIKGNYFHSIDNIKVVDSKWRKEHWNKIKINYQWSHYFDLYAHLFQKFYEDGTEVQLSVINYTLIEIVNEILGIDTKLSWSGDYTSVGSKSEKLVSLCKSSGADVYLSGPSARAYLNEADFNYEGITVEWVEYNYLEYRQLFPPFNHGVTILDLLFNEGPNAKRYMKSFEI